MTDEQTHAGSCHCGAVTFEVRSDLSEVMECNCSHCFRKGLWLTFVQPDAFTLKTGEGALKSYLFNKHNIEHRFCSTCGVEPFGRGKDPGGNEMVAVNIRTLTDIEPYSIEPAVRFDGRHKL